MSLVKNSSVRKSASVLKMHFDRPQAMDIVLYILLMMISILSITSCKPPSTPATTGTTGAAGIASGSETVIPIRTDVTHSPTQTGTPSPTQIDSTTTPTFIPLEALDPGQYLVKSKRLPTYGANLIHDSVHIVINMDGDEIGILANAPGEVSLSPDQSTIAHRFWGEDVSQYSTIKLRSLVDQHERHIDRSLLQGSRITWSSDGDKLAFTEDGSIAVLDLESQELIRVLDCPQSIDSAAYCVVLGWSSDDHWIAHRVDIERSGSEDPQQLTYLLDTDCFSNITTCASVNSAIMPFRTHGTWSPDGRFFAGAGPDGDVYIFNVAAWEVDRILSTGRYIESIQWSPDGQWLAFSSPMGIGLISPVTGDWEFIWEASPQDDVTLAFWLSIDD